MPEDKTLHSEPKIQQKNFFFQRFLKCWWLKEILWIVNWWWFMRSRDLQCRDVAMAFHSNGIWFDSNCIQCRSFYLPVTTLASKSKLCECENSWSLSWFRVTYFSFLIQDNIAQLLGVVECSSWVVQFLKLLFNSGQKGH
jgi:hypothetical protein